MSTINHILVARSNWAIARECEHNHKPSEQHFFGRRKNVETTPEATWNTSKRNLCSSCFEYKSVNGSCACE